MSDNVFYSNKFTIEVSDITRIIFLDERAKVENRPNITNKAGEAVLTNSNAKELGELLVRLCK